LLTLKQHIAAEHGGNIAKFARLKNTTRQNMSKLVATGLYYVINGKVYKYTKFNGE